MVKPDGVQRGLVGPVISRLEARGLKLVGLKLVRISRELASRHYAVHQGKPFYEPLLAYITSSPVVVMVWEGSHAIAVVRNTMGVTRPDEAAPGTIRGDYALDVGRNIVHGSDGSETATFEIPLFFREDELIAWDRSVDPWILE
jgi:nucleoside-diphosphate kinase